MSGLPQSVTPTLGRSSDICTAWGGWISTCSGSQAGQQKEGAFLALRRPEPRPGAVLFLGARPLLACWPQLPHSGNCQTHVKVVRALELLLCLSLRSWNYRLLQFLPFLLLLKFVFCFLLMLFLFWLEYFRTISVAVLPAAASLLCVASLLPLWKFPTIMYQRVVGCWFYLTNIYLYSPNHRPYSFLSPLQILTVFTLPSNLMK